MTNHFYFSLSSAPPPFCRGRPSRGHAMGRAGHHHDEEADADHGGQRHRPAAAHPHDTSHRHGHARHRAHRLHLQGGHGTDDGRPGNRDGRGHGGRGGGRGGDKGSRRPLERGDLRLLLLAQIAEQRRHGYELIQLISDVFAGAYVPSPGVIYPTLALLEDMGLIAAQLQDGRKRYHITEAGHAQMQLDQEVIAAAQARTRESARRVAKAALPTQVREAMDQLKHRLLARQQHWTPEEANRIAAILAEASTSIGDAATH